MSPLSRRHSVLNWQRQASFSWWYESAERCKQVVPKRAEGRNVPTIVRWRTSLNATEWSSQLTWQRPCSLLGRRLASLWNSLMMMKSKVMLKIILPHKLPHGTSDWLTLNTGTDSDQKWNMLTVGLFPVSSNRFNSYWVPEIKMCHLNYVRFWKKTYLYSAIMSTKSIFSTDLHVNLFAVALFPVSNRGNGCDWS